jgi:hypothetical protein
MFQGLRIVYEVLNVRGRSTGARNSTAQATQCFESDYLLSNGNETTLLMVVKYNPLLMLLQSFCHLPRMFLPTLQLY